MTKKQALAVTLPLLSLAISGVLFSKVQEQDQDVSLAEEPIMEENIMEENVVAQAVSIPTFIANVEALAPTDQNVINALSSVKSLYAQKNLIEGQIAALVSKKNYVEQDLQVYMQTLQTWMAAQPK